MSATRPQAKITDVPSAYDYTDLPVASVTLSASTSVPSTGASSITAYLWTLVSKPDGSSASITGSTTASCSLIDIDLPGTYLLHLKVTDDLGRTSLDKWYSKQDATTKLIENPDTTSMAEITVLSENLELTMPAAYSRSYANHLNEWLAEVDRIAPLNSVWSRTRWVQMQDGPADADGSPSRPFNPNSATANSFAGPIAQALDALNSLDLTSNPFSGRTLVLLGGTYTENISITNSIAPWQILCLGTAYFSDTGGYISYSLASSGHLAVPNLLIAPQGAGALVHAGQLRLGEPTGTPWSVIIEGATFASAAVTGSLASGAQLYLRHTTFTGAVNLPNAKIQAVENGRHMDLVTAKRLERAIKSTFASVTLTEAGTSDNAGFSDCGWEGTPTFTGPSGSATFCPVTAARFFADGGSFSGGAGVNDGLKVGQLVNDRSSFIISAPSGDMAISAAGSVGVAAAAALALTCVSGDAYIGTDHTKVILQAGLNGGGATDMVVARGAAAADADLAADIVGPDATNKGVTIRGRGTHTADLKVNEIREDVADAGVTIEDVLIKDGAVDGYDLSNEFGIISARFNAVPTTLKTDTPLVTTAGTSEETLATFTINTQYLNSATKRLRVEMWWTSKNNTNSKTYTVKLDGTAIGTLTFSHGATSTPLHVIVDIIALAINGQMSRHMSVLGSNAPNQDKTITSADFASAKDLTIHATTATAAGDLTLDHWAVTYHPAVA